MGILQLSTIFEEGGYSLETPLGHAKMEDPLLLSSQPETAEIHGEVEALSTVVPFLPLGSPPSESSFSSFVFSFS